MAKVRQLLLHVQVEVAEKKRVCHRNRATHSIPAGDACLAIYGGSRGARKNYCRQCAKPILDQAHEDLRRITDELYGVIPVA